MKKRILAALLCAGLVAFAPVGMNVGPQWGGVFAQTVSAADNVSYIDANGASQTANSVTPVTAEDTAWSEGWYVVTGTVEIGQRVAVNGDVHLILADGCNLTVNGGIGLSDTNANITIYGQDAGSGQLTVQNVDNFNAGIGANDWSSCGSITINGGTFDITGGYDGAGIGGSRGSITSPADCGVITIYNGTFNITGGSFGAGIGSGDSGSCTGITIYGGMFMKVQGGRSAAGIGSGASGSCDGGVTIHGGTFDAIAGGDFAAGIGGGYFGSCGDITVTGGSITVSGGLGAAAIGGGYGPKSSCDDILISGGFIKVTGGAPYNNYLAACIGSGAFASSGSFSTGTDGHAVIIALAQDSGKAITDDDDTTGWNGIFFLNNDEEGLMKGTTLQPTEDFEVPLEKSLTIAADQTLIIPEGVTLTVNGKLIVDGKLIVNGTLVNNSNITGTGTIEYGKTGGSDGTGTIDGPAIVYPTPDPEPEDPEPSEPETPAEPSAPSEEEKEVYLPSTPISDGLHEYSLGKMFYVDGKRVKGLYEYQGATYYFNEQGFMQTGWVQLEDGWRYFDADGKMAAGWLQIGNAWYYLDPETGIMYDDGLRTIGKSTYYFYDWGGMASDWWYEAEDGWYFFGGSGAMKSAQWLQWKGHWYYLTESGKMAVSTDIGGYYVDAFGVWIP